MNEKGTLKYHLELILASLIVALLPVVAWAAELDVAGFVEVTVARLKLAEKTWSEEGRGPTESEEANLLANHGTTLEAYLQFSGEKRREIAAYLEANPDQSREITRLSDRVRQWIEQVEAE